MKKTLMLFNCLLIISFLFCLLSCDHISEPYGNNSDEGASSESLDTLVYIGESTETIDGITYTVQSYADIIGQSPYFYTYYKYFYLNSKLRKVYIYSHGFGSNLDYEYTEFVEHYCGNMACVTMIYSYYDNGKLESMINKGATARTETYYFENGNKKSNYAYSNNQLTSFLLYYNSASNNNKLAGNYNSDGTLSSFSYYYPSGNYKYIYFNSSSILTTYGDGETTGTTSNYSQEQALAKLEELMDE